MILIDLDNTIIKIDSDFEWNLYNNKINSKLLFFKKNIIFYKKYNKNKLNAKKYSKIILNILNYFKNICNIINYIIYFYKKIIKNKIKNNLLFIFNFIKINKKILINTSTNKNLSKIINNYFNIKLSKQSNNKTKRIKIKIKNDNYFKGILNYKEKKLKNFLILINKINNNKKFKFYSDSCNDIIWIKKNIISINPDKKLTNNSVSNKKKFLFLKLIH